MDPEATITCIDCGGRAHRLTYRREDGTWLPGDIIAYRCEDCLDRWDVVLPDDWGEERRPRRLMAGADRERYASRRSIVVVAPGR